MNPRPYQQASLEAIIKGFEEFKRQLLVLPTGGGKTIVFSWLAKLFQPEKTLIIAHREELISQAIDKLHASTGITAEKEKAEFDASLESPVVVASIQTLIRRLDKWSPNHFGLIVVDEAHHVLGESYLTVLNHFTGAKILGVTATADRGDKRNLGEFFENVAYEVPLFQLINDGFLCPITIRSLPIQINLSGVKQTAGDYDANGLDSALAPYMDSMAAAIKEHAAGRKSLVFLPLIATSKAFTNICRAHGLNAEHIDGESENRRDILDRFARREFDVLCNAMLLTEGYDDPTIDCIVNLRPTRSRPLYSQIVGRGTRIAPGKTDLLLLDFLFIHERLKLIHPAHLIAKTEEEADAMTKLAFEKHSGGAADPVDLQALASETQVQREKKLREELQRKAKRRSKFINAQEFFLSIHKPDLATYEPEMKWEAEPVTDKQSQLLEKFGFDAAEVTGKGHASQLIGAVLERRKGNLAAPKQMRLLKNFGHPNPELASFTEASVFIELRLGRRKGKAA